MGAEFYEPKPGSMFYRCDHVWIEVFALSRTKPFVMICAECREKRVGDYVLH